MHTVIVADDLTGAADAAAPFAGSDQRVVVLPWRDPGPDLLQVRPLETDVLVIETDTRTSSKGHALQRLQRVGTLLASGGCDPTWLVKKVDSQLRGPIATEVAALRRSLELERCIAATALPALGRTTSAGVQYLDGHPVGVARDDPRAGAPSAQVSRACGFVEAQLLAPGDPLPATGEVIIDAATDDDLDRIAGALGTPGPHTLLIATSGLTAALARRSPRGVLPDLRADGVDGQPGPVVVLSLTPAPVARDQVAQLTRSVHAEVIGLDIARLLEGRPPDVAAGQVVQAVSSSPLTVLQTVGSLPRGADPTVLRSMVLRAIVAVVRELDPAIDLIANGGDATRGVVDALAADRLEVLAALPAGSVLLRFPDGRRVVTKSGSFGPPSALTELVAALTGRPTDASTSPAGAHP